MIIFSQSDYVALWCDLEATAAADFDIGTLKLANQRTITLKNSNMKTIAMTVSNQDITSITDINAIGIIGDIFTSNAPHKLTIFIENHNTVTLKYKHK